MPVMTSLHRAASPRGRVRQQVWQLAGALAILLVLPGWLGGCAVVNVASTAASLVVGTVGLAADVTIGAARVTGKAIGAVAGAATPSSDEE